MDRDDVEHGAVADSHRALVRGLTAAAGVEARAVEGQAIVSNGDDSRVGLEAVIVLEVEPLGRRRRHAWYL